MRNQRKNRNDLKGTIRYLINLWIIPLVFLLSSPCLAFEKVKFVAISDPHISSPQQKGVSDGYRLGLKT